MSEDQVKMPEVRPEYLRIGLAVVIGIMYASSLFENNLHGLWLSTLALTLFTLYHLIEYYFENKEEKLNHG